MINTTEFINKWDYRHYLAFLYIAVASADYDIGEDEKDELHAKLAPSLFNEENYKELYNEVLKVFGKLNDNDTYNFISDLSRKHVTCNETKEKVLKDLKDIIDADDHETPNETIMYISIRKILNGIV
ncbi:MAG: TerB family tellurite resistance protein [Flavobacteriales bacterium]|nr:TerB family tellurite resistance protein [Flavobacteriales bacterium]MCB9364291.1 TerB family tellurite resistance protein [Flavobacteriales bacterium]